MSNYPDDFRGTNMDAPPLEDISLADAKAVSNAQEAYRECVEACISIFKRRGITNLSASDLTHAGFAMGIEDVLEDSVRRSIEYFTDLGYDVTIRDDDHQAFFRRMSDMLKGKGTRPVPTTPDTRPHGDVGTV